MKKRCKAMLRVSLGHRYRSFIPQHEQQGFSLLEVVIATAILMGSAVVLSRLAGMGREQAQKAARYATAQQLCEQTLNEVLLGQRSVQPVEDQPLLPLIPVELLSEQFSQSQFQMDGLEPLLSQNSLNGSASSSADSETPPEAAFAESNPEWLYSLRTEPRPETPGMWAITLEVRSSQTVPGRPIRFSLTRWIAGPPPPGAFDELQFRGSPDELDSNEFTFPDQSASTLTGELP